MPRLIDADERTAQIAAASMRVLERDGLAGLSVRGVAEEAGIATASLRRAFPTQHALREHCLRLIEERASGRIAAASQHLNARHLVEDVLSQLLPLDSERRTELIAQVQLGVLALTDAQLRPTAIRLNEAVGRVCSSMILHLQGAGGLGAGRDPEYEALRLNALLDGIALQALWPDRPLSAKAMRGLLSRHLDELALP
ncbi:TetR/AcrR family transcriptional regulator [Microbacterium sp. 2MCAF23]|uniref:TetR/AcrR family transcriptional regulator n=1 Tax=Microbacterium sp. 2MCAF23 TaxID=3232985 RepID=UPI003F9A2A63